MDNLSTVGDIIVGSKTKHLIVSHEANVRLSADQLLCALQLHAVGDRGEDYELFSDVYKATLREDVEFLSAFRDSEYREFWVLSKIDGTIHVVLPTEYEPAWKDPQL